jgi:hypothetical protein
MALHGMPVMLDLGPKQSSHPKENRDPALFPIVLCVDRRCASMTAVCDDVSLSWAICGRVEYADGMRCGNNGNVSAGSLLHFAWTGITHWLLQADSRDHHARQSVVGHSCTMASLE